MEVIIEYAKEQNPVIEEVLSEHLNDGWSVQKEDGVTVVDVDIPDGKIIRLAELGIKVNTLLPKLEKTIQKVIGATFEIDFYKTIIRDINTIDIMESETSSVGQITLLQQNVYFVHGNVEPSVRITDPSLPKWIQSYLLGFDEFEKFLKAIPRRFTVTVKKEFRLDVVVAAASFDEAFENALDAAKNVPLDDQELVEEEPVHAERDDGKEADYGFHPYADE